MRFRKLRIAWSVFWAVGFVLLIALWVRSYSVRYLMTGSDSYGYHIALGSNKGYVYLVRHKSPTGPTTASYFAYGSGPSGDFMMPLGWTVGPGWIKGRNPVLLPDSGYCWCSESALAAPTLLPPHSANRSNPGCGGAGVGGLRGK